MKHPKKLLVVAGVATLCCALFGAADCVLPFAEEPIGFRDFNTGQVWDDEISTVHCDATYAMAIAAGFADYDAATIAIWDQLVDSGELGPGNRVVYSNCGGSSKTPPDRNDPNVCPDGCGEGKQVWPVADKYQEGCTTSRYGPYAPMFHWLHQTWAEVGQMRLWGWGYAKTINGYAVYAWGDNTDVNVFTAKCRYLREEVIYTGIKAGSLKAFATYVHTLADSYSHLDCLSALADTEYLWGNHTLLPNNIPDCYYFPAYPHNDDTHGQEFGNGARAHRTVEALLAVYNELVARSMQREGKYVPLTPDTVLTPMAGQPTLSAALSAFVYNWDYQNEESGADPGEYAANRRAYAEQIAIAARALRQMGPRQSPAHGR